MRFFYKLFTLIYPERCPYCSALIEADEIACDSCREKIRRKHIPIRSGAGGFRCVSTFIYGANVRRMIIRMKYHDRTQYIPQIAVIMADDIRRAYPDVAFDLITCVPMHRKDQKQRGYNQSEMLAKSLGKLLGLPYLDTLEKVKHTRKQHKLKAAERKKNLKGAFRIVSPEQIDGKAVLMIDDIVTSGATLTTCCKALSKGKPKLICCATIAKVNNRYPQNTLI